MFSQYKSPTNKKGLGYNSFDEHVFLGTKFVKATHAFDPNMSSSSSPCTSTCDNAHVSAKGKEVQKTTCDNLSSISNIITI